ncbi:uncharacterized protein Smr isoform X2 [Lepeophtheirus salmonis]|uniref:uncharacterized protein Smr isoform X2 n=1 Tax=Lepeophtheirus salmonis TaxID=72036 RepID=UPI001AE4E0F5|nr:serine/arginine repetitive matrix protein 2-like isoform X2 [Lepeophtheirus salmonis]
MSTVRSMDIRGGGGGSGSGGGGSPSLGPPNSAGPNSAVATGSGGPSPHPSLYGRLSHPRQPLGAPYLPSSSSSSGPGNDHLKGRSSSNNNNNINVSSNPGGGGSNNYCRSSNSPSVVSSRNSSSAVNSPYPPQLVSGFPGSSRPPPSGGGAPDHPASMRYVQYSPSPAGPSSSTRHPPPHSVGGGGSPYESATVYIQSQGGDRIEIPVTVAAAAAAAQQQAHSDSRHSNHPAPRMTLRPTYPNSQASSLYHNDNYMRDVQAVAVAAASAHRSQPAPPSSLPAGIHLSSIHSQSPSSLSASHGMEIPPKRPRMDLGHPNQISSSPAPSLSTPLRIDTREPNKDSGYHPQVEAISPTGPEASAERDELRSTKDDLLQKITKVDREIAKAESQIAKLKKKQQELEDAANRPSTDAIEEDEKPKNQSIAQIIYAENRKKARDAHAMLDKLAPHNELPLYNQPSDTVSYHENKRNHAHFKKQLVEYFKKRNEERESRERHMTETYSKLTTQWLKKVEKLENSKKRREKEQRARDLYEKIFPELRKQREDKERDHRLGTRGAVRSEADIENVIERLQEQELENKKMHSYAVIPPLLLPQEERRRKFINNNGLILDPLKEYEDRKYLNIWTEEEKQTFKERFLQHPKNFGVIAQSLERKNVSDAVQYYYLSKKTESYKQIIRKNRTGSRRRKVQPTAPEVIGPNAHGVVTRHRNREQEKLEPNENNDISNRSTPVLKSENNMKSEDYNEEEGDKKFKKEAIDTSDDEESNQIKSGPPHPCAVCKVTVEASRPVHSKSYAIQLGLREEDVGSDSRVCNKCHCIALRKRHGHCPVPTCTSTKGRGLKVKNRFRHLPSKWAELPDEIKGPIIAEMQLPEGIKKCCSGCVTRLTRKISQASSGISNQSNTDINVKNEEDAKWSDEDVELMKNCLVEFGRNWTHVAEKIRDKTPDQCKKFFYNNRKKFNLDKIVLDFKRANQSGDQPPVLSTDEESGSSTSSCDEETTYNNVNTTASTSASTVVMHVSSASTSTLIPTTTTTPSGASTETSSRPTENDIQVVKSEVKSIENHIKSESGETAPTLPPPPPVVPAKTLIKEEDNDSSTTMSADEVEINPPRSIYSGQQQPYLLSGQGGVPPNVPGSRDMARSYSCRQFQPPPPPSHHHHHHRSLPPPPQPTLNDNSLQNGPVREVMTVRDLMSNVIERQLSNNQQQHHHSNSSIGGSIANPTIHTILENSGPAPHKTNYIRDRIGLNPLQKSSTLTGNSMAPPPPPPQLPTMNSNNDCETLDLSMPRRREPSPINNNGGPTTSSSSSLQYREPVVIHRSSTSSYSEGNRASPPPAHSGSKAVTVPDLYRDIGPGSRPPPQVYPPDGVMNRSMSSPHIINRASPRGPPPPLPPVSNLRFSVRQSNPASMMSSSCSTTNKGGVVPQAKPNVKVEKPLMIQTGSITQGTPVNHPSRGASYEPLLRVTPQDKPTIGGSITHGTPVYDKKDARLYDRKVEYYGGRTISPGGNPSVGGSSSRAVIMNDFAMARSTEMQRRPDSREQPRSASPRYQNRDLSPRSRNVVDQQRIMTDPRATITAAVERSGGPRDSRYNMSHHHHHRVIPDVRGDPKAELATLTRGSVEIRGDPRAGLDHPSRGSSSVIDYRNEGSHSRRHDSSPSISRPVHDHRAAIERNRALSAIVASAASGSYPPGYPMYMTPDGKYVPMHPRPSQSPSRSTPPPPPPSSSSTSSSQQARVIQSRGNLVGGITSGKPVVSASRDMDYYRGHPEVTISKTNSGGPRMGVCTIYNDQNPLNSLVDVAVKQPKLPDPKLLDQQHKDHGGGKSAVTAAAVAALHQQQTRMVAAAAAAAAQQQQQQKFVDRYLPSASNTQQLEAALAVVAAASSSAEFSKSGMVQAEQERQKQQNLYKSLIQNEYNSPSGVSGREGGGPSSSKSSSSLHVQSAPSPSSAITPHKIIDAIIHQQHQQQQQQQEFNQQQLMSKYRRSPAVMDSNNLDLDKQQPSPYKVPSRSPSVKSDNNANGPEDSTASSSRPGSRSGLSLMPQVTLEHENYMKKNAVEDYHWRRNSEQQQSRQTPPSRIGGGSMASDERQITRVIQQQQQQQLPLRPDKPPSRPGLEPISPPNPSDQPQQSINLTRYMDPRRRIQASHDLGMGSSRDGSSSSTLTKVPHPSHPPPGIFTMEYVNNKIVEEMKKNDSSSGSSSSVIVSTPPPLPLSHPPATTSSVMGGGGGGGGIANTSTLSSSSMSMAMTMSMAPPVSKLLPNAKNNMASSSTSSSGSTTSISVSASSKRAHDEEIESPRKRLRDDSELLPDSPGSGEMVIDESARPDSVSSHKTASPAPLNRPPLNEQQQPPPQQQPPSAPRYEPLSDDE